MRHCPSSRYGPDHATIRGRAAAADCGAGVSGPMPPAPTRRWDPRAHLRSIRVRPDSTWRREVRGISAARPASGPSDPRRLGRERGRRNERAARPHSAGPPTGCAGRSATAAGDRPLLANAGPLYTLWDRGGGGLRRGARRAQVRIAPGRGTALATRLLAAGIRRQLPRRRIPARAEAFGWPDRPTDRRVSVRGTATVRTRGAADTVARRSPCPYAQPTVSVRSAGGVRTRGPGGVLRSRPVGRASPTDPRRRPGPGPRHCHRITAPPGAAAPPPDRGTSRGHGRAPGSRPGRGAGATAAVAPRAP
jgi:hypothetical protein